MKATSLASSPLPAVSDDLFGASPAWPQGLRYVAEFVSVDEERQLLDALANVPIKEAQYYEYTARRRIASFGKSYDFAQRTLLDAPPLPAFLHPLRNRVATYLRLPAEDFAHALINEYRPGTPLGWHRDAMNFEVVAGVSLGSSCQMRFRPYPPRSTRSHYAGPRGEHGTARPSSLRRDARVLLFEVQPRSLYTMQGDARWKWQHSVSPTRRQRWSITFRTMRSSDTDPGVS